VLNWQAWEEVVAALEKLETLEASLAEELADDQRWDEAFAKSQDVLERLADEALADYRKGRTRILDPDQL
jgi:hypothetical protein